MITTLTPLEANPDLMAVQIFQGSASVYLQLGVQPSHYVGYLSGISLDEEGEDIIQKPVKVFICESNEEVRAENEELTIFGFGQSSAEAITDFIQTLSDTWEGLKDVPDANLTEDAISLRDRLAEHLGRKSDSAGGCN